MFRLGTDRRLLDAAAFDRVFRKGTRSRDKWFTVLCLGNDRETGRLGLAIAKKHCRRATTRNRIKRIVRESFRSNQAALAGLDVVVLSQAATGEAANPQLFDSLERHWRRCRHAGPGDKGQD